MGAETVVPIGEFARLTHLSVKALRHYHDRDILVPAEVDPFTCCWRGSLALQGREESPTQLGCATELG
jgi:MerR family regulatory protein